MNFDLESYMLGIISVLLSVIIFMAILCLRECLKLRQSRKRFDSVIDSKKEWKKFRDDPKEVKRIMDEIDGVDDK